MKKLVFDSPRANLRATRSFFKLFKGSKFLLFVFGLYGLLQPQCKCSETALNDQINNTNSEPEYLEIAIEPCNFCSSDIMPCWETPGVLNANVSIEVRTASKDATGNIVPDATPYFELDQDRSNMSCSGTSPNNKFTANVPKKGAYFVRITIKSLTCSICCNGTDTKIQCGTKVTPVPNSILNDYDAGKPKWVVEKTFIEGQNKPVAINGGSTAKWAPTVSEYLQRACTCGCIIRK